MLVIGALLAGFYLLVFRFTRGALRADGERYTNYLSSLQVAQESLGGIRDVASRWDAGLIYCVRCASRSRFPRQHHGLVSQGR